MKRTLVMLMVSLVMLACGEKSNAVTAKEQAAGVKDCVEVLYFHGKQRCVTCRSIEKNTKDLLDAKCADLMRQGKVVWRVIDILKKESEAVAEKYQVTWSSLFVVKHKNGKEQAENLTDFAFKHSRTQPDKFKAGVEAKLNELLK